MYYYLLKCEGLSCQAGYIERETSNWVLYPALSTDYRVTGASVSSLPHSQVVAGIIREDDRGRLQHSLSACQFHLQLGHVLSGFETRYCVLNS